MSFKQKYLKYKIKYFDLKNQIGGIFGTDACPEKFDEHDHPSIFKCLRRYNCTYE